MGDAKDLTPGDYFAKVDASDGCRYDVSRCPRPAASKHPARARKKNDRAGPSSRVVFRAFPPWLALVRLIRGTCPAPLKAASFRI